MEMEMERVFFGQWIWFKTFVENFGGSNTNIVVQNKFPAIFFN